MTVNKKIIIVVVLLSIIAAWAGYWFVSRLFNRASLQTENQISQEPNVFEIEGLTVEILQEGAGSIARLGDRVLVTYIGYFGEGRIFDRKTKPFIFTLGKDKMIRGWVLGVEGMRVKEKRRITIPPHLAYGSTGFPPKIPPNATLVYEITLEGILLQ